MYNSLNSVIKALICYHDVFSTLLHFSSKSYIDKSSPKAISRYFELPNRHISIINLKKKKKLLIN